MDRKNQSRASKPGGARDRSDRADRRDEKPTPRPAGMASRRAALDILTLIGDGASLDEALEKCRSFNELEGADRRFARAIATTVLRRRGALDHLIGAYIDRPLPKRAAKATDIIRCSAAQTNIMGIADHAAISIAVALAKEFKETAGYAGLVNAVARKIAKSGAEAVEKLAARVDTPGWLWRSWERAYGPVTARAIAKAHQSEPPLDLTPKDQASAAAIAKTVGGEILPTGSVRLTGAGFIKELSGYEAGDWWVQDVAASLPAKLFGDLAGKRVFDLCAAPGGKTLQLAAAGARVLAVDQHGHRLRTITENLARTGLSAETVKADVLNWAPAEKADAILLDAPCSATGTIRRHPDILWFKKEEDVEALAAIQAQMIDRAVSMLKPGGVLVYCVCSLQREEGEQQAAAALKRHPGLARIAVTPDEIGGLEAVTGDGDLRTLPSMLAKTGGMDGFFAARLKLAETGN